MRFLQSVLLALSLLSPSAFAQDAAGAPTTKHEYQSDVARLRKIVIESLYSHRDVFLRELISNANDAIEKLRLTALTDKTVWDGSAPLNITLQLLKDEDNEGGRLIISDTGIGMTPEELTKNLGTLAKSGTSEFLAKAEGEQTSGNLIGAFGLGFYSSFLVADRVYVASLPPPTEQNPEPVQHVFSSSADDPSFEVYQDPRGNTLGRGTEITLVLKKDALEYLQEETVKDLVAKHSSFSTTFPIYLFTQHEEEIEVPATEEETPAESTSEDDEEAVVEDSEKEEKAVKKEKVILDEWIHLNAQPPLWARDPKDVTDEEYKKFYQATFKDHEEPLSWLHFKGDSGSVSFKAIMYLPSSIPEEFWQSMKAADQDVRLMVKRVFITNDLGEYRLPKWISWIKVVIDADDLPLNVSRETLQNTKFLKQIKGIVIKRFLQLMSKLAEEDPEKYEEILKKKYNSIVKLGSIESTDQSTRKKLAALARFPTTTRESVGLDSYVENRKEGQDQIFFLANVGHSTANLKKSVFVEKLTKRGYEVLLMNEAADEVFVNNLRTWSNLIFQDVSKKGLKYGDEDPEADKAYLEQATETHKPLISFFTKQTRDLVKEVIISNRLVTSPCAIVVDTYGYSANMEKLLATHGATNELAAFARRQRVLEINPKSPLIEGLLKRVEALPSGEDGEEKDVEAEAEIEEVVAILIDGALVRSGFEVEDTNLFFERVDRALRRSLGVSEHAKADDSDIKPAPPTATEAPVANEEAILNAENFGEWSDMKAKIIDPELESVFGSVPRGVRDEAEVEGGKIINEVLLGNDFDDTEAVDTSDAPKHDEL